MMPCLRQLCCPILISLFAALPASHARCSESAAVDSSTQQTTEQPPSIDDIGRCIEIMETSQDSYQRADAAARLADYEDQYERFVKPLAKLLVERDEVISSTATRIFQRLGKPAVDALQPDFQGSLDHLRQVCSAIHAVGDGCEAYIPQLLAILKDEDDIFRRTAATFALTGFSDGCPQAIDLILQDLAHEDMNVTLFAMRLIIKTGQSAQQASAQLVEQFEKGVPSQRGYAIWSLSAVGPVQGFDTLAATEMMLNRFTVSERERGLIAAGLLADAAHSLVPKVKEMMGGSQTNLEGQAAITLWQITGQADESLQRLVELSRDSLEYEVNGLKLMAQMGADAAPALEFLQERLEAADPSIRVAALDTIRAMGPAAASQREAIEKLAEHDSDPLVKLAARQALASLTSEAEK